MLAALLVLGVGLSPLALWAEGGGDASQADRDNLYLDQVEAAADEGRFVQATAMLGQTHASRDTHRPAVTQAQLLAAAGRPGEALAALQKIEAAGYRSCRLSWLTGGLLDKGGKADEAEPYLWDAVGQCPGMWRAWEALALHFDRRGQWDKSGSAYEQAFRLTDRPARVANNYGMSLFRQGQVREAANLFAEAVSLDQANARYRNNEDAARLQAGLALRAASAGVDSEDRALRVAQAAERARQMQEALTPDHATGDGTAEGKGAP
ncbi:hypothetical protein SAMN02927924_03368 [Sphingobium faniae]|nr:hypothetical protein SAMN02927924_03368 [Sphingobium faniae]